MMKHARMVHPVVGAENVSAGMRRICAALATGMLCLVIAGCSSSGTSKSADALAHMRAACVSFAEVALSARHVTGAPVMTREQGIDTLSSAAQKASQAAALDPTWSQSASSLAGLVDAMQAANVVATNRAQQSVTSACDPVLQSVATTTTT